MALDPHATLAEIEKHFGELKSSLAKCPAPEQPEPVDEARSNYHAAYVTALTWQTKQPGWSLRRVAEFMSFHVSMICKWRDLGWREASPIPGYVHLRMPAGMRAVFERELRALETTLDEASNG
jgi:hypothetical protein